MRPSQGKPKECTLKSNRNNVSTPPVEIKDPKYLMVKHYHELKGHCLSQPSASTSGQNISIDSDSNNVVTAVLVEKPTEEDLTIIAVGDTSAADHVNVDDVCMAHRRAEDLDEPQTSTFFENMYKKSSYDLGNFTNKILSDNKKRQILDMGPLQPSGPFPTDINQNNRCIMQVAFLTEGCPNMHQTQSQQIYHVLYYSVLTDYDN
ncbi:hypothetical protein FQA39_LY03897 [Lamprigera yunnana]|nr:hypothetical protein FQA39_LY03897 [Lamprigera yunnana]